MVSNNFTLASTPWIQHTIESEVNCLDNLGEVVSSDMSWGLILYGEEEEKVMAASTDPVISKIWEASPESPIFILMF